MVLNKGDHFWFNSIFIKKNNQTEIFLKKINQNRTKTGSNRPVSVRFCFFREKTSWFKPVWLGFSGFGSAFSVLARFFWFWLSFFRFFFSVSVQFFAYKTEPVGFFKILIGFFSVRCFRFFSGFLGLIGFLVFLLTPSPQAHIEHELNLLRLVLLGLLLFCIPP